MEEGRWWSMMMANDIIINNNKAQICKPFFMKSIVTPYKLVAKPHQPHPYYGISEQLVCASANI